MIGIYLLGIITLIVLIFTSYCLTINQVSVRYIPTNLDGTILKKENLQEPTTNGLTITDSYVIDWVQKNIQIIYDLDYLTQTASYRSMINLFTPEGFTAYANQIESRSKILDTLIATKSVLHGYGCGNNTVTIEYKGVEEVQYYPVYTWRLSMPVIARVLSSTESSYMRAKLTVSVQRVPQLIAKNGLAIYGFVISEPVQTKGDIDPQAFCQTLVKTA